MLDDVKTCKVLEIQQIASKQAKIRFTEVPLLHSKMRFCDLRQLYCAKRWLDYLAPPNIENLQVSDELNCFFGGHSLAGRLTCVDQWKCFVLDADPTPTFYITQLIVNH